MNTVCNACEFLSINEEEQDLIKNQGGGIYPHICRKYKKKVIHFPYSAPDICPCDECLTARPTEKGDEKE